MFEVDVKNVTEKGRRRRRRGLAWVWGSDDPQKMAPWRHKINFFLLLQINKRILISIYSNHNTINLKTKQKLAHILSCKSPL